MPRWESGARQRLQQAALPLFQERGYDGVTVAEIAAAAGLTERTFFRHFTDKREVLFQGQDQLERSFLDGAAEAPGDDAMSLARAALDRAAGFFPEDRRPWARARQTVIDANPALQERELLKLSALATALTRALAARGIDPVTAALAGESAVTVFRTAFTAWIAEEEPRPFAEVQAAVLTGLHALLAPGRA
jgi:AcrR family transcriptional regulator